MCKNCNYSFEWAENFLIVRNTFFLRLPAILLTITFDMQHKILNVWKQLDRIHAYITLLACDISFFLFPIIQSIIVEWHSVNKKYLKKYCKIVISYSTSITQTTSTSIPECLSVSQCAHSASLNAHELPAPNRTLHDYQGAETPIVRSRPRNSYLVFAFSDKMPRIAVGSSSKKDRMLLTCRAMTEGKEKQKEKQSHVEQRKSRMPRNSRDSSRTQPRRSAGLLPRLITIIQPYTGC